MTSQFWPQVHILAWYPLKIYVPWTITWILNWPRETVAFSVSVSESTYKKDMKLLLDTVGHP
jgi:hypothetical protein